MSTRGCYRFSDGSKQGPFTVFKHSDNYPEGKWGGLAAIAKALEYAWPLPRFEADEFAAAFVSANKPSIAEHRAYWAERGYEGERLESITRTSAGGNVRLLNTPDAMTLEHMPGDIEYLYDVSVRDGVLWVKVSAISGGWNDQPMIATILAEGTLVEMREHFKERDAA